MLDWHCSGGLSKKSLIKCILSSEEGGVDEDQVDLCGRERHICGRAQIDVEENWVRALL